MFPNKFLWVFSGLYILRAHKGIIEYTELTSVTYRKHSDDILYLIWHYTFVTFQMRSTGIPELTCVEDTDYIRMAMLLDYKSERKAEEIFCTVIQKCLNLKWTVQLMWKAHNVKKKRAS